ncbi:MAG: hypothetical protein HOZ81_47460 [Streptomyces sp.]|nr:hypothetical protein [Streptomyces sp.]
MTRTVTGVHITPDGNRTTAKVPTDNFTEFFKKQLDGWPEYAHYGTTDSAVCVVVHETSMSDGHASNVLATKAVERIRGGELSYNLHGTVVLVGYQPRTDTLIDLSEDQRSIIDAVAQDEDVRAWQKYMAGMTASPAREGSTA